MHANLAKFSVTYMAGYADRILPLWVANMATTDSGGSVAFTAHSLA